MKVFSMLTTTDNPFNPFDQFDDWYSFDVQHGYNTCSYLARIAQTSPEMSNEEYLEAVDQAIDEILEFNILGIYKRVTKSE